MAEQRLQRRLAAILSADVVGYSRLMGIDEAGTLARLKALRRDVIDPNIAGHSGRIVKLMGDGVLVEFGSAVDAVACAIEIQKHVPEHEAAGAGADSIRFRSASMSATLSSMVTTSLATASTSRLGSKALLRPEASRFPRTPGGKCRARWRPNSSMTASTA